MSDSPSTEPTTEPQEQQQQQQEEKEQQEEEEVVELKHLVSAYDASGLKLKNRVAFAPLTRGRSGPTRVPNDLNALYYEQRAGAGLVITEGTTIDDEFSNGWKDSAGIYTPEQVSGWKKVTAAVHAKGAAIVCQLWHLGPAGHSLFLDGRQVIAASAIKLNGERFGSKGVHVPDESTQPYEEPRSLPLEEIPHLVDNYRKAAENAKAAGFDGVEIHSANGYLLNTFLDSRSNKRTDKYGAQNFENRTRLLNEVIDAIATVFPSNRIGVRLSPNGIYNDMGSADNIEVYTYVLQQLGKRDLLYTHVMDGLTFGFHQLTEPFTIEMMRKAYGAGTLICNCGYTRETGEQVVAAGHANLVAYGRPFIGNPDLVYRFAHNIPLSDSNPATWFTHDAVGYADYPTHLEIVEAKKKKAEAAVVEEKTEGEQGAGKAE